MYSLNDEASVSVSFSNRGKNFNVVIKAWRPTESRWAWNIYVNLFERHPLFESNEAILNLPFHGGVTYDKSSRDEYLNGDLRGLVKIVGCDYMHLYDDFENCSPLDGIPYSIKMDAEGLFRKLKRSE
tara:strand:+ start:828 stop:1208 length:381 start_codon:yes stop_codon:yes gene_type:complete